MFQAETIERAVELQRTSYRLLRWLTDAIERGFISFTAAHRFTTLPEAFTAWVEEHHAGLPPDTRPTAGDLPAFAHLFTTYLEGSFDLVEDPGQRLASWQHHCFCPLCSWLVDIPRLQPKQITRHARRRARDLEAIAIRQLALELDVALADDRVAAIAADPALREARALVAYAHDLLRRMKGISEGTVSLALWRGFAWRAEGSPKQGFELTAAAILDAERALVAAVERA
jgi:hypothetical protein